MFLEPYQTTVGSAVNLKPVHSALKLAIVDRQIRPAVTVKGNTIPNVFQLLPEAKDVPPFSQPVQIDGKWYLDARAYISQNQDGVYQYTNPYEADFLTLRGHMAALWANGGQTGLETFQDLPMRAFVATISNAITMRLGLGMMEQFVIQVAASFYYLSLFQTDNDFSEEKRVSFTARIARNTRVPAEKIMHILDQSGDYLMSLNDFVNFLKIVITNPRIHSLNAGIIVASTTSIWYGAFAKETVAIAMEYPPYWNALVYTALSSRSFQTTQLSKTLKHMDKKQEGERYQAALYNYRLI